MAKAIDLSEAEDLKKTLLQLFQSGHINFLIGSGASHPAIPIASTVEADIAALLKEQKEDEAREMMYDFLATVQTPTNRMISGKPTQSIADVLQQYQSFLGTIEQLLFERRTALLPKQASIFTTNYDLMFEMASAKLGSIRLNDGFDRVPCLDGKALHSPRSFYNTTFNTGNLYTYRVELPCINLIKLHGSLSWVRDKGEIAFRVQELALLTNEEKSPDSIEAFLKKYSIILPQASKLYSSVLDTTYYEQLRLLANELERENVVVVAFGFSFNDEHILRVVKRGLKNPTARLLAFAYDEDSAKSYMKKFTGYKNVDVLSLPAGRVVDFAAFNELLSEVVTRG